MNIQETIPFSKKKKLYTSASYIINYLKITTNIINITNM